MKTKRCGIYAALAAAVLVTALLITSCLESLGKFSVPGLSANVGIVRINFGNGRTIMPTAPNVTAMFYDVYIDGSIANNGATPTPEEADGLTYSQLIAFEIPLAPGSYTLKVDAYRIAPTGTNDIVVATYEGPLVVNGGMINPVPIDLVPADNGEDGTLTWALTFSDSGETGFSASLTVFEEGDIGGTPVAGPTAITAVNTTDTTGVTIPAGTYHVRLTYERGAGYKTGSVTEVLYIYDGLVSNYTDSFPALNSIVYAITLDYRWPIGSEITESGGTVNHGDVIATAPSNTPALGAERPGYSIIGWTRDIAGTATPAFVFGASGTGTPVYRPYTFYAKWEVGIMNVGVEVTFDIEAPTVPIINGGTPVTVSHDYLFYDGGTVDINISGASITASSTKWYLNPASPTTGATLTLNAGSLAYLPIGTNTISVDVVSTDEVPLVSANFTIVVTP